jgi:hypothetical protein
LPLGSFASGTFEYIYDIEDESELLVTVLAVGKKLRNRVVIGDEELDL